MAAQTSQHVEDLVTVYRTFFLDLPLAGAWRGFGLGEEKETVSGSMMTWYTPSRVCRFPH